jgi:hypothetical protein
MHRKRKEKILRAVENGLMRVTGTDTQYEAISRIVEKRAQVAMDDSGRAGNDAAKIVLAAIDALPDRTVKQEQTVTHEYSIDPDTMRIVEQMVRARRDGIIDAEYTE